ncbi:MAG: YkgJ family cysteine cluster protein [Planctomycetota bacterium]
MPGILCEHCTGACCRYIALPIETPDTRPEFDDIRWYLLHENISVFVEDGEWFINMVTPCRHLQADNRCGIYATRPRICRQYTTEKCDYHSGDYGWEQHFTCPEHLDEYVREFFRESRKKTGKKRKTSSKLPMGHAPHEPHRVQESRKSKMGIPSTIRARQAHERLATARTDISGVPLPGLGGQE